MSRGGVGVRISVYSIVFGHFFEILLLATLEPHAGHTKFPGFYTLSHVIIHEGGIQIPPFLYF